MMGFLLNPYAMRTVLVLVLWLAIHPKAAWAGTPLCQSLVVKAANVIPRLLDAEGSFANLVDWIYRDIVVARRAPGLVVGVSGTDSVVAFLAAAKAFERAGKPDRVAAIHYGERLPENLENPEIAAKFWFQLEVLPWLKRQAPHALIKVDDSVDSGRDGVRWGALMDWSVLGDDRYGRMRPPEEQYWVVGTRNATEAALFTYSNASMMASVQPLIHLWKSDILIIAKHLGVPQKALDYACQADCVCGRLDLWAYHIPEVDSILLARAGLLDFAHVRASMTPSLFRSLEGFVDSQVQSGAFKGQIPYASPEKSPRYHSPSSLWEDWAEIRVDLGQRRYPVSDVTKLLARVIEEQAASQAVEMTSLLSLVGGEALPEMLALFNTPGLRFSHKQQMVWSVFGQAEDSQLGPREVSMLSVVNAKLGYLGFGFPRWRFLTKAYAGGPSLVERFGMQKLVRANDRRLGIDGPMGDEFGVGFVVDTPDYYLEFRRAYVLVSLRTRGKPLTLVVRNNSTHFGRDRLAEPVYISFQPLSTQQLKGVGEVGWLQHAGFAPWQELPIQELGEYSQLKRVEVALDIVDQFEAKLGEWMSGEGRGDFEAFLRHVADSKDPSLVSVHLSLVERGAPSWWPGQSIRVLPENLESIRTVLSDPRPANYRHVFTSSAGGDYP